MNPAVKRTVPKVDFVIDGIYTTLERLWDSEKNFTGESHPYWEFVFVESGQVEVVEEGKTYFISEGEIICHAPNEFHRIKSSGGTSPHFFVLTFSNTGALPKELKDGVFHLSEAMKEDFLALFKKLHTFHCARGGLSAPTSIDESYPDYELEMLAHEGILMLTLFILALSKLTSSPTGVSNTVSAGEYRTLIRTMKNEVNSNLRLSDISDIHHISISYITKLFCTYAGVGPMSYYAMLRLEQVKKLLTEGKSVSEIAEIMSFSSAAYLSAFFKSREGLSPIEWLKQTTK